MAETVIHTKENWAVSIAAMHSGECIQIDAAFYYYFLEVLPPVYMDRTVELPGFGKRRVHFGFAEGAEQVTAFWSESKNFYCQRTKEMNHG